MNEYLIIQRYSIVVVFVLPLYQSTAGGVGLNFKLTQGQNFKKKNK